jgi:pSer/pThr/pTyr-binding forkhead associated (FHA) protein
VARAIRIGRHQQVDLRLNDVSVSRVHAQIEYNARAGGFVITDNASTNGVFVNGQRIAAPKLLRDGDVLEIGTNGSTFAFALHG